MEFDESKVYTALNADKLKIGSEVIVADNLGRLKSFVKDDCETKKLVDIRNESKLYRFHVLENDNVHYNNDYALAYLVSEPEEKKLKWTDLKIGDTIRKDCIESMVVAIDRCDTCFHILACKGCSPQLDWIGDTELEEWEKVND